LRLRCSAAAKATRRLARLPWMYEQIRICRKWQVRLPHIVFLMNTRTSGGSNGLTCDVSSALDISDANINPPQNHLHGSRGQHGVHVTLDFVSPCVSMRLSHPAAWLQLDVLGVGSLRKGQCDRVEFKSMCAEATRRLRSPNRVGLLY